MNGRWPRAMKKATAAAYCELSIAAFEREIIGGRLPAPIILGEREHWCIKALDKALDAIKAETKALKAEHRRIYDRCRKRMEQIGGRKTP